MPVEFSNTDSSELAKKIKADLAKRMKKAQFNPHLPDELLRPMKERMMKKDD